MRYWLWIVLLPASSLLGKEKKLGGYVMDAAAFRRIQTYCFDTHNLPSREVRVINQFVTRESKHAGLLSQLPWRRLESCKEDQADALVRVEFPSDPLRVRHDVNGVLFVFRSGSPSPIYETREVLMGGAADGNDGGHWTELLEGGAAGIAFRTLVHDWQQFSERVTTAAYDR